MVNLTWNQYSGRKQNFVGCAQMCRSNIHTLPCGPSRESSAARTHVDHLFEYVAQAPPTPVIPGKWTFPFSFLWFICTEGCFGMRPQWMSEDLAGFLRFSCQWSTSTVCRSGSHSYFCAGLCVHLNPPFLAFFCPSTKPELPTLHIFLPCVSFASQFLLLHCALMLFLYPDQEIGF